MSPDPPRDNSFVKVWEEGLYEMNPEPYGPGKWATTADIAANHGKMNFRIPAGMQPGQYAVSAAFCFYPSRRLCRGMIRSVC